MLRYDIGELKGKEIASEIETWVLQAVEEVKLNYHKVDTLRMVRVPYGGQFPKLER